MSHALDEPLPSITPNNVIQDPVLRRRLGVALYITSGVAAVGTFVLTGVDLPIDLDFWAARILGGISLASSIFGLGVTTPNVPRS